MKNILNITFLFAVLLMNAQVAIGKSNLTTLPSPAMPNTVNPSVSLEFGDYVTGQGKGLVLPWTTSLMDKNAAVEGTIIYDTTDHIIKYKNAASNWVAMSKNETVPSPISNTQGVANTVLQDLFDDMPTARTSIGTLSTVPGILVLEDTDKAMVLPKVESPHLNIINPEPGTMVYDTVKHQLAVYNGKVWSFWKP